MPLTPRAGRGRLWAIGLTLLAALGVLAAWAVVGRPADDPDRLWQEAESEFRAGRHARAADLVARLARARTPEARDWLLFAQVAMAKGRTDEALADLARIPDGDPLARQARLLSGQLELRRSRTRRAEALLKAALALDPKLVQAHRELIYIYGVQSRRRELNAEFRALSDLAPLSFDNIFHWCLTRNTVWEPAELSNVMAQFLRADPDDRWSRLGLAEALRHRGRIDEAEATLAPLPADDPEALELRARIALDRGDDDAAERLLSAGPADGAHPSLARLRGRLALARRDGRAAVQHFRAAYDAEPDNRDTIFGLAAALTMAGDPAAAAPFQKLSRDHDALGSLMQRAGGPGAARDPALLRRLGAACEAIHRLREARAWYQLAIQLDPLDPDAQQALYRINAALAEEEKGETIHR